MTGQSKADISPRHLYETGQVVFSEGEIGDTAYFIESGALEVTRGQGEEMVVLAQLGAGEIIGEMALVDASPRSATVRAIYPTQLSIISRDGLQPRLGAADALVQLLVHSLLRRLRAASHMVSEVESSRSVNNPSTAVGVTNIRDLARQNAEIESRLRNALASDELQLHYQPIVDLKDGRTVGFEALVRWPKPDGRYRLPGEFLGLAEKTDLILQVDEWVIRRACRDIEAFGHSADAPYISVNISNRQLSSNDFLPMMSRIIDESHADPQRLQIEVPEGAMITSPARAADTLAALRAMGVHIALDDFGTGYSSLGYLHKFHANVLKIDRSFVLEMRRAGAGEKIVRAIAALGTSLEMTIIVEGVENRSDAEGLLEMGCELAQGFGYSQAMPLDQAIAWMANGPAKITA